MIDYLALRLLLRNRLLALSVCTTGAQSLSAVSAGYSRTAGSFITDGFVVGMEVNGSGFAVAANNGAKVITSVTATTLSVAGGCTVEAAAGGRTLAVGLPSNRLWENIAGTPPAGQPHIEEDFVTDNPPVMRGLTSGGVLEATPMYVIRWYGLAEVGTAAIEKSVQALLNQFLAGTSFLLQDGTRAWVRGDLMPSRTRLNEDSTGKVRCTVTVPLRVFSVNTNTSLATFGGGAVFG